MTKYQTEIENLRKACDIAIEAYTNYSPKNWKQSDIDWFVLCTNQTKSGLIDRKPPYNNLSSLKYEYQDVFTYFQEGSGQTVEEFWKIIREEGLPYKRENKLAKILKRGKVKSHIEYDFIKDLIGPYKQEGIISESEESFLDGILVAFEVKNKK
ncbi:hypothetical protein [Lacihabitans lacunae]|uniref:Uncharacterized protein n=1 Tax=Lacihabitans lacunae TaxID=1028214 RepID=A0ABV7Z0S0_9BACT